MDKKTIILIIYAAIILTIVILKFTNFSKSSRKRGIRRWFYFNDYDIINSPNEKVRTARKMQNRMSMGILFLLLLLPILFLLVLPLL